MPTRPDPSTILYHLASAIATAEGFFHPGTVPARLNNPGDLRAAPWLAHPVRTDGFWAAPTRAVGLAGLYHQIALDIARGVSLRQLVYSWAPPTDGNNTEVYLTETARRVGITDLDEPLQNYLDIVEIP